MPFSIIVAADRANGIGLRGSLPWPRLKADLEHFKALTLGHAVIMGRKTWDSLPASVRPLPGRDNIVLTRYQVGPRKYGAWWSRSLHEAEALARTLGNDRIFVIGGAQVYALALAHPELASVYLTRIDAAFECDAWLPPLDGWRMAEVIAEHRQGYSDPLPYRIERWVRATGQGG